MMRTDSHIFDVQASEPREVQRNDGTMTRSVPSYSNLHLHVLAPSAERAIELVREHHPEAVLHQIIKRNAVRSVIVDPDLLVKAG